MSFEKEHHMRMLLIIGMSFSLVSCAGTLGRYSGDEFYYSGADGVRYSCREPKPYPGGNCKRESDWSKQGLN